VPAYSKSLTEDGEEIADKLAADAMATLAAATIILTIAAQLAMPWLMIIMNPGYVSDPEKFKLSVILTQLAMPYLACMTAASLLSGVLNTGGRFALSAAVPVFLNLCTLAALLPPMFLPIPQETVLLMVTAAVTVSGVIQAGLLWWGVRRLGVRLRIGLPRITPNVRHTLALAVPGALAGGALQINSLVSQFLTGSDEGARSVLYNADRLYQLPLGLVGVAIGLALVPRLTKAFVSGDHVGGQKTLDDGINLAMAFTLPAAVALFVIPFFIIDATVTRGAFTSADAARTADVLRQFAWGVPAFVLAKVLTPPFFARQDTRRPMIFAVVSVVITVILGSGLFFWFSAQGWDGVLGLAIATSVSAWINVGLLAGVLVRENSWRPSPAFVSRLSRVLAASAVMAGLLLLAGINYGLLSRLLLAKEIAVLVVCGLGAGVYGVCLLAFRAVTVAELKATLRREPGGSAVSGLD
jgi:putative peptidoglycan lipid II flippase